MAENARRRAALRKTEKEFAEIPADTHNAVVKELKHTKRGTQIHMQMENLGKELINEAFKPSSQEQAREEGLVTFVSGYVYSQIETFSLRFGIPVEPLAERVGQFLLNTQRR